MNSLMRQLATLREKQVIRDIDFELCRFLNKQYADIPENVLLAACLVSYLYRQGNVCLLLQEYAGQPVLNELENEQSIEAPDLNCWRQQLKKSPAVGTPGDFRPLILDDSDRLYLHKLWHYEYSLAQELIKRSKEKVTYIDEDTLRDGLNRLFAQSSANEVDWQQVAAATAVQNKLSIISGGPGTGKTSTVVRVLALILEQYQSRNESLNIALAAPTGKAAARLKDSILSAKEELNISDEIRQAIPDQAQTIHQLLGARRHSSKFRHSAENPVPYDLVIIDEASMVDQALMSKLVETLLDDAQLILLGDKDQLASVEAGSVLGDICDVAQNKYSAKNADWLQQLSLTIPDKSILEAPKPLTDNITLLTTSYRFKADSGIAKLSEKINSGDAERAVALLTSEQFEDIGLQEIAEISDLELLLESKLPDYFRAIIEAATAKESLSLFDRFRVLSAHRKGPWGISYLNRLVAKILQKNGLVPKYAQWYPGRPVIININDYTLGLFNGDTGVCLPDENGELKVYFRKENAILPMAPSRLPDHDTAYALTVHKSQGSEFDEVLLVLPGRSSKVLSRELIYTAITRARTKVIVAGKQSVLKQGIKKRIRRSSGLRDYLWSNKDQIKNQ